MPWCAGGGCVNRNLHGGVKSAGKSSKRVDAVLPDNPSAVVDVLDQKSIPGAERESSYKATLQINWKTGTMEVDAGVLMTLILKKL